VYSFGCDMIKLCIELDNPGLSFSDIKIESLDILS